MFDLIVLMFATAFVHRSKAFVNMYNDILQRLTKVSTNTYKGVFVLSSTNIVFEALCRCIFHGILSLIINFVYTYICLCTTYTNDYYHFQSISMNLLTPFACTCKWFLACPLHFLSMPFAVVNKALHFPWKYICAIPSKVCITICMCKQRAFVMSFVLCTMDVLTFAVKY